eukprot:scaffold42784_cov214-Amphora_coffeaeformis.AAC.16
MKQLVYAFPSDDAEFFVVALNDRAFVGSTSPASGRRLLELLPTTSTRTTPARDDDNVGKEEDTPKDQQKVDDASILPLQQIQAVAGCQSRQDDNHPVLFFAVARQSKQLCIYCVTLDQLVSNDKGNDSSLSIITTIPHLTLHQSPKRVSSMVFADIPATTAKTTMPPLTVLVTGDLAGDAFAYSLTQASTEITAKEAADEGRLQHRRLLVGHTASMLTSVAFCSPHQSAETNKFILTADRDEKIRVTHFPSTFEVHGFLFGHTAFVSCMTVAGQECFSCGGDSTLRVWNVPKCQEQACLDLQSGLDKFEVTVGVPCEICVGEKEASGRRAVAVIYDRSNHLDLFSVETSSDNNNNTVTNIVERTQISLPGQPLGLASLGSKFIVLVQEPHYVCCYDWNGQVCDTLPPALQRCNDLATHCQLALPTSVLERDNRGELKMSKNVETRSSAHLMPWNNAKRKDIASASKKRSKKRRQKNRERDNQDDENGNEESGDGEEQEVNDGDEVAK